MIPWQQRCQTLERELRELATAISHDLRAPLRAVDGFARVVEQRYREALDDEGREYLGHVRDGARTMGRHIDGLVQLVRLSVVALAPRKVELDQVAGAVVDELRRRHPERKVQTTIEEGLVADMDPQLCRRLLEVMLANAWFATRAAPEARIEVGRHGGDRSDRRFFVRDNGEGFDRARAERLFEPFARVHPPDGHDGLGLGLAVARRIVERHGGTIEAESEPGRGATFSFTISEPGPP